MNMPRIAQGWLLAALAGAILCWTPPAGAAVPASWKETGFAIEPSGMTLRQVLEQFGQVYGVQLSLGVANLAVKKEKLRADGGAEFLDRLAQQYRFRWFVYGDTLHVVPREENTSVRLEVGEDAVQDAKGVLVGMGLYDSRFGWGELPDEGIVVISGPREYVRLAREILLPDQAKVARKERQIMLFRLKYASATDRVISARGKSETIPGIKSILSRLIFEQPDSKVEDPSTRYERSSQKRSRKPDNGKGEAREVGKIPFPAWGKPAGDAAKLPLPAPRADAGEEDEREERAPRGAKAAAGGNVPPRIEADPSLNAIMIYDLVSKRAMYQSLIDQLDVQPQQIEIEALIIDIDRNKLSEMGVEWGVRSGQGNVVGRVNATQDDGKGLELPLPGSTLLISNAARFYARLKAMEGNGEARVLATPTVLTLNNVAAVLDLSQTRYMPLVGERIADLADITAGTMLRVIPRMVQDGAATRVRLEIDIEDGALGDSGANANVTRSTISTQAIIEPQQTLMIGGYRAESLSAKRNKVPLLGDVPVLGHLFRNDTASESNRERLFLITPRLVGVGGMAAAPVSRAAESAQQRLAQAAKPDAPARVAVAEAPAPAAPADQPGPAIQAREPATEKPSWAAVPEKRAKVRCRRAKADGTGDAPPVNPQNY
ncbi:type III secretion system outer membrane ring subunit SctC [Pseudoduganella namucuonensis]|uniref:Type 3 secretion system secretin n=1 Tax=Pseudoduganella namucuonensis TaxID=1035707 RepID=A0A1I7L7X9_9BURK|nr:type III secretion system outer membrane ring subunit SctC [Pseudoduganella namucuonensis]SFV05745.1 type III secretion protein C [Pseudoduganella namucuonensis]